MKIRKKVKTDNTKKLQKILKELKNSRIKVGVFGKDNSELLMIAKVNEFGCDIQVTEKMRNYLHSQGLHLKKTTTEIHIPERSFIRKTYDEHKREINGIIKNNIDQLITFRISTRTFFERIGTELVGLTQEVLTLVEEPKNHPFTLEQKRPKTNPLINTGRLRESITFKIE